MILKRITKTFENKPYNFQVADLEGRNWKEFICGGFYDGVNYFEFRSPDEFCNLILNSEKSLNIFCHFGGIYDFLFFIQWFLDRKIEIIQIVPRGSGMLTMRVQGLYKQHTLRDSSAILPFGLEMLTKKFNVETKKGEYDHSKNRGYNKELSEYLKSDCLGLYQVLKAYFNSDLVRKVGPASTIASQAQKLFRSYLKQDLYSLPNEVNEFCRGACMGGRVEIFKPLGKNLKEYDVNSLYPSVMKANKYPSSQAIGSYNFKREYLGIYEVEVDAPDMLIPIIGLKHDGKLIFPTGQFTTRLTSREMIFAEKYGYKFKVIKGYYFKKSDYIFSEFISDLYKLKENSDPNSVDYILSKLLMNSSFGKFAIKKERENLVFDKNLLDELPQLKQIREVKTKNGIVEVFSKPVELKSYVNSAIGAFILADARIKMMSLIQPIADKVYYTDTDSIFTTANLESSKALGDLKLESIYDDCCFLLPKTYIAKNDLKTKIAMKGFDKRKIKNLSLNEFKLCLQGELNLTVKHDKSLHKFKSALKYNELLKIKNEYNKTLRGKYNKRILNLNKNNSKAIKLNLISN